jgi:hypothetical protein
LDAFLFEQEKIDIAQEEKERRKAEEKTRREEEERERRQREEEEKARREEEEEEEKARREEEARMKREAEEKVVALLYFGSVLYKHGEVVKRPVLLRLSKDGRDLVYSTCLSAEMVSAVQGQQSDGLRASRAGVNSKTLALAEVVSVEDKQMEAPGTFGIRTVERYCTLTLYPYTIHYDILIFVFHRLHQFDAKTEAEKRLWAKAIQGAMSMLRFKEEDLPQLQQGVNTKKHGALTKREVRLCLSEDASALEYVQVGSPETKKYIRMASVLSVEPEGDDPKRLTIQASDGSHSFDMESSGIKDQWVMLLRAALSGMATQQLWKRVQSDPTLRDKLLEKTKKDASEASAKAGGPMKDVSETLSETLSTGLGSLSKGFGNSFSRSQKQ